MTKMRYLVPEDYMADPAVHIFNGRVYIYPSHDWDSGAGENDNGDHFEMRDYHVFSTDDIMEGKVVDHGKVLDVDDIPWAGRQLWDCDVAEKDGRYYMYFPLKDKNDVFHIGVAVSDRPEGPFTPMPDPIRGSYSIDPAIFREAMTTTCISADFGVVSSSVIATTRLLKNRISNPTKCRQFPHASLNCLTTCCNLPKNRVLS